MKNATTCELSKTWWKKEAPADLKKSGGAFEKALDAWAKAEGGLKSPSERTLADAQKALEAVAAAGKLVAAEARELAKKAKDKKVRADLENTAAAMGKPLAKAIADARDALPETDEDDAGDLADPVAHAAYVKKMAGKLKRREFSFALGLPSNDPADMRFAFHPSKGGRGLVGPLKKEAGAKKVTWGKAGTTALTEGTDLEDENARTLVLKLEGKRIPGLAKRVKLMLRKMGVSAFGKVVLMIGDQVLEDADDMVDDQLDQVDLDAEDEDEPAERGEPGQPAPAPAAGMEDLKTRLAALVRELAALPKSPQLGALAQQAKSAQAALRGNDRAEAEAQVAGLAAGLGELRLAAMMDAPDATVGGIWSAAVQIADGSVGALAAALRSSGHPDLLRIAENGLGQAIEGGNRAALARAVENFDGASGAAKAGAGQALRTEIGSYRAHIAASPVVQLCERNPFGVGVAISAPIAKALDRMEQIAAS